MDNGELYKNMKRILLSLILVPLAIGLVPISANAVTISAGIPGTNPTAAGTSPGAFVANFYQFALLIGGILAFGAIVYGGVLHAVSAGNPSRQSEGKQWIWSALWGLLLLAGAYLILNTVNPNLLNLNLPTLSPISIPASSNSTGGITGQQGTVYCGGTTNGVCPISGQICSCATGNCSCVTQSSFTCGGTTNGTCPGNETCQRTDSGAQGITPTYACHT
jgi:hypothetical protein